MRPRIRRGVGLFRKLVEQFFLLARESDRRLHGQFDIQIAVVARLEDGHSFGAQAQPVAALASFGDFNFEALAPERGDFKLAAERRRRHGDGHLAVKVGTVALEELVFAHRDEDVEVAVASARGARRTLAAEADARSVINARGDINGNVSAAAHASRAVALGARGFEALAFALALGASLFEGEEALGCPNASRTPASRTCNGLGSRGGTRSRACRACDRRDHGDFGFFSGEGFFQGDGHVVSKILSASRTRAASRLSASAHDVFEQVAEDVREAPAAAAPESAEARKASRARMHSRASPRAVRLEGGMSEGVVGRARLLVFQDFVGFVDILELLLGAGVAGILVGMVFLGELSVSRFYRLFIGISRHAERFVIALFCHSG